MTTDKLKVKRVPVEEWRKDVERRARAFKMGKDAYRMGLAFSDCTERAEYQDAWANGWCLARREHKQLRRQVRSLAEDGMRFAKSPRWHRLESAMDGLVSAQDLEGLGAAIIEMGEIFDRRFRHWLREQALPDLLRRQVGVEVTHRMEKSFHSGARALGF